MALPRPDEIRRPRGNPNLQNERQQREERTMELNARMRDLLGLEVEERFAQQHLGEVEGSAARLRNTLESVEAEAHRHLDEMIAGLREHYNRLPACSPERAAAYDLYKQAAVVAELEARARQLRRSNEDREAESRRVRERLVSLTHRQIGLARGCVEMCIAEARNVIRIDARGASVQARDINIG